MKNPDKKSDHADNVPIFIDDVKYELDDENITGAQLRALVPVPDNQDLWLDTHGNRDDELIAVGGTYIIKPGSQFYTAPSTINPGGK